MKNRTRNAIKWSLEDHGHTGRHAVKWSFEDQAGRAAA
jgi:hypothetical protein